jgi:hypothetical protein
MLDRNEDGSVLDQWAFGNSPTPPDKSGVTYVSSDEYLANYQQAGFKIFRLGFDNASYELWHQLDKNDFRGSVQNGLTTDKLLNQLQAHNYQVVMTIFGFEPLIDRTNLPAYLDYVVARYSPWVDVWELSNEAWPDDDWVKFVSSYIKAHDPLHHPVTISWERQLNPNIDLASIHYYWNEEVDQRADPFVFKLRTVGLAEKPVIVSEFGNVDVSWDSAWLKVPTIIWNHSRELNYNPENANIYLGPIEKAEVKVLNDWLAEHQADQLQPIINPPLLRGCYGLTNQTNQMMFYCTNTSLVKKTFVLNLADWSKSAKIDFSDQTNWQITWFDPKTGQVVVTTKSVGQLLTTPTFDQDLVGIWQKTQ